MDTTTDVGIGGRPFRLGFFSYLLGDQPRSRVYAETLQIFGAAADRGFDTAWVAQQHFGHLGGLPSPFVFFAALAARAPRIGVGTAVVALPLEHPLRVAEDAAVFETLYPGRLHVGLGTGIGGPATREAFGLDGADKRERYDRAIERLLGALGGEPVDAAGDTLVPAAPALRERIWEAPATPERVAEAARRGSGLLLSRIAFGAGERATAEVQVPLVERYLAELPPGVEPRIGLSRTVYPTRQLEVAFRDIQAGLENGLEGRIARGFERAGLTIEERFAHHNVHWGRPEDVVASLRREPLLDRITDLICQVQPGLPSLDQTLEAVELLATEVAPALGWWPADAPAPIVAGRT